MTDKEIILVGGGGHCRSCIDVIEAENKYTIKGIIDHPELVGNTILSYPIIGSDDDLKDLAAQGYHFLITVGYLGKSSLRKDLFDLIKQGGGTFPVIVSPHAGVSKHASIDEGTIIMHHALVNSNVRIGKNNIVNNKSLIEHDVSIGNHNHISTSSVINGSCSLGDHNLVGSGTVLKHGVAIANNVLIGAGSLVLKNISYPGTYVGSPAKRLSV
jgi:sugar O-acyltransferase (sialic acid O-acetyltransferase NeuD family)